MSLIESESAFKLRCSELDDELFDKLKARKINCFSVLGFAVGSPQANVDDADFSAFADKIFGAENTIGNTANLRRLHFEAVTFLLADLQAQVSSTDVSEPVRKLPFVEKQSRLESQKNRLTGLLHKPDQQPSHGLIDLVFGMVESGSLTSVHPSKCHSREQEVHSESKNRSKQIVTLEQGSLKASSSVSMSDVDTSSELRVFALQRRHLAFELVNLLSWPVCQQWLDKLMTSLMTEPHSHAHAVSLTQVLKADRQIFSILAAEHSGTLKAASGQDPPLDETFKRLMMHDPRINVHLIAYQKLAPATESKGVHSRQSVKRPTENTNDANRQQKKVKSAPNKPHPQMPAELVGLKTHRADGSPLCWQKNFQKGCNNPTKRGRCRFGFHDCMRCLQPGHGAWECNANL